MSSLIFFGQGGELFMGEDGTAEERLKSLLGDSSDRAGLARRRIVRRPLSGYQAQSMLFSERDAASSLAAGDPLSEMFMHLAATRKEQSSGRTGNVEPSISATFMSGLAQLGTEESFGNRIPHAKESSSALTQLRSCFVQEMMLSALTDESTLSQMGPLDADYK
ncbi:hypothetical protein AB1Y20_015029 [Prymnesium parvum]|uniref:Uncharacterized protein n=1 Tax=Prymnesium parvum TaxID=97485 RepID=A0AB34K1D0_PRYPA|mmetsp:Transcript_14601/g.21984  ORF Transcript_14601/g.21984 Transcript_14601/m.21984 type:complete len:164 (+) Transcript_14601:49-540(+)